MKITLLPDLVSWPMDVSVNKETITINGESFDFSVIPDGYSLPGKAVGSKYFVDAADIFRKDGDIHLTLLLPVTPDSPEEFRNPAMPIELSVKKGKVAIPDTSPAIPTITEEPKDGPEPTQADSDAGTNPEGS